MKRLGMARKHMEVRGRPVTVVITTVPRVFAFFGKHRRGEAPGGNGEN